MRVKINMDTIDAAKEIEAITNQLKQQSGFNDKITITDSAGFKVSASSFIGLLYALEFNELWLEAEGDYYKQYEKFIVGTPLDPPAAY